METFGKLCLWVILLGGVLFGFNSCVNSDWFKAQQAETEARERRESTPHVIREADGCKVYAFKAGGNTHFFTRCGDTVTTDRSYTENCGKNCTRHKTESIVTKENK